MFFGGGGEAFIPGPFVGQFIQDAERDGILSIAWKLLNLCDGALKQLGHVQLPSGDKNVRASGIPRYDPCRYIGPHLHLQ